MPPHSQRSAGALWLAAGLLYLTAEAIAAGAFPGYSYAHNYISDLGVPYPGEMAGRPLRSALAWVMNWGGFILDGTCYGLATVIAARASPKTRAASLFLALGLSHAIGTILVGTIHSGNREVVDGTHFYHVMGAAMAILGGNAALLAAASLARDWGLPKAWAILARSLGGIGFIALGLLETSGHAALPEGLLERISVYTITAWEILTGMALLAVSGGRGRLPPV